MPLPPLSSPGVYVTEIPSGNRAITGVSTSVTAFVGRALMGPVEEPVLITSYSQFQQEFGGLWRESALGYAVRDFYLNGGGAALVVRLTKDAKPAKLQLTDTVTLAAMSPGGWGNRLRVDVTHPSAEEATELTGAGADPSQFFHLKINEVEGTASTVRETFLNVTLNDTPRKINSVLGASRLLKVDVPEPGGDEPGEERPPEASARPEAKTYAAKEGADGENLTIAEYDDDTRTFDAANRGLFSLNKADLFNILCLPPSSPGADLPDALWASALTLCQRKRAFLIVDPPAARTATDVHSWVRALGLAGEAARNAALYFPRTSSLDPLLGGATRTFVACGAIAGTMARTDSSRGVWKAPAGIDAALVGVGGLAQPMTDRESGALNPQGINCLRTFPQIGSVLWGARTLRGADLFADDYKYVSVRRLALFLEESLYRGTQWVVFEPNDESLWSQIRASLGSFMQDLFRQGAFQGRTPREGYFVACDAETTTQYDIDRGIVNIVVGFAPLKPTEFVVIAIQQKTAAAAV
ncbi:phage tail sheath family protein [Streptomyces sp. NPDC007808]|uniref:phage tail sheath family protein n=1 Tax=Streptomyces sp. NPDC007808 TaxID=3364779 RepID=UPI0036A30F5E